MTDIVTEVVGDAVDVLEIHGESSVLVTLDAAPVQILEVVTPGPQGPRGDVGAQGEPGPSPGFEQHFATPSEVWLITHPLGGRPEVTTVDLNGAEVGGDVEWPDAQTVIVRWGLPMAGTARLKG